MPRLNVVTFIVYKLNNKTIYHQVQERGSKMNIFSNYSIINYSFFYLFVCLFTFLLQKIGVGWGLTEAPLATPSPRSLTKLVD